MASINYPAIKLAVHAWVSTVAGQYLATDNDGNPYVFWVEDAHGAQFAPYAKLELQDGGRQGKDHTRWVYDEQNKRLSPIVRGNRQLIVSVEIRSRETVAPRAAIEDLRTSLEHPLYMQELQDNGGLAFVRIESCQHGIGILYQGRSEALAVLEVRFAAHAELADATETVESVERAGLTNQVTNTDGSLVDPDATEELVGAPNA